MRQVQFKHERLHDSKGNLNPKGGRTFALEVPTVEEFKSLQPSLSNHIMLKSGMAECSKKDHYNKQRGRDISLGRMQEKPHFVTMVSADEIQVTGGGAVFILRLNKDKTKVYFEEVI